MLGTVIEYLVALVVLALLVDLIRDFYYSSLVHEDPIREIEARIRAADERLKALVKLREQVVAEFREQAGRDSITHSVSDRLNQLDKWPKSFPAQR